VHEPIPGDKMATGTVNKSEFLKAFGRSVPSPLGPPIRIGSGIRHSLQAFPASLLVSSKHSDVSIYLGPQKVELRAHYAILSIHTNYFDAAKERGFAEGLEDKFYFPEGHPHAFYRALQYMYTGDYSLENNQLDVGEGNYANRKTWFRVAFTPY
jgi:BTB/POZ domain